MVTIKRKNKNQLIWGSNSLVINKHYKIIKSTYLGKQFLSTK